MGPYFGKSSADRRVLQRECCGSAPCPELVASANDHTAQLTHLTSVSQRKTPIHILEERGHSVQFFDLYFVTIVGPLFDGT